MYCWKMGIVHIVILTLVLFQKVSSMYIPEDIEILDGYDLEEPAEYYPQDIYYEAKSLSNIGLTHAIRNKRSSLYRILESAGLRSHSLPKDDLEETLRKDQPPIKKSVYENYQRNIDKNVNRHKRSEGASGEETTPSILPTPEKQVMEPDYYRKGAWTVQTFNTDYAKHDDDDSMVDATNNDGIKGRTPRVNFITQPKKNGDESKDRPVLPKVLSSKNRFEKMEVPMPDIYPSRSYDPYLRRYDRYDDQYTRYDPYYEDYYLYRRRYDPYDSYSPRTPSYPEPFYDYPDSRFDVPEPRDYRPMYSNDIYDRPPYEPRNRRIIYYAHLPEIVRPPSLPESSYNRYGTDRYDSSYIGPAAGNYRAENPTRDLYGFVKREKKDYRNYQSPSKGGISTPKRDRE